MTLQPTPTMTWIMLQETNEQEGPTRVQAEHISFYRASGKGSAVFTKAGCIHVKETPEQIDQIISAVMP